MSNKDYKGNNIEGIVHCTYCGEKVYIAIPHDCFIKKMGLKAVNYEYQKERKEAVPCGFCGEEVKFGSLHNCDEKQNYIKYLNIEYQKERKELWKEHNIKGENMKDVVTQTTANNGDDYTITQAKKSAVTNLKFYTRDLNEEEINLTESQLDIIRCMDSMKEFLLEKNRRYGDSALHPKRIFSKATTDEQILVRLDDKISRIMNSDELRKNDLCDTVGYLMLLAVSKKWTDFSDQLD